MSYVPRIPARVDDQGVLRPADPLAWRQYLARQKGRDVWLTVVRQSKPHTSNQRAYYWAVVVDMVAASIGESREETHELLKAKFLPEREIELLGGKKLTMPPSTKLLSTEEYSAYIERIRVWSAQWLGVSIPDASQVEVAL